MPTGISELGACGRREWVASIFAAVRLDISFDYFLPREASVRYDKPSKGKLRRRLTPHGYLRESGKRALNLPIL